MKEFQEQYEIISRGAVEILPDEEFRARLKKSIEESKPLRVKQGFDPTAPDIHIGHTVGIRKLKQFQELGHQIVLIVGDYTGLVGDPSGRSATRPQLSYEKIMANAETYQKQFFKILDESKTEIHFNGEWFSKMNFREIMQLAAKFTLARMLERDDFDLRFKAGNPISVHELFYPLMQAYDSVVIKADVEIGATEQKFNLLTGREIQGDYGVQPQMILTLPVLVGTDGVNRMSKSLGNYIGIDEAAGEMFGKVMSIPDDAMPVYFELCTDVPMEEIEEIKRGLQCGTIHPMDVKKRLGREIVTIYHSAEAASEAQAEFERVFSQREVPEDMPEVVLGDGDLENATIALFRLVLKAGMAASGSEARRLIQAGAVTIDGEKLTDPVAPIVPSDGQILRAGKLKFGRLRVGA